MNLLSSLLSSLFILLLTFSSPTLGAKATATSYCKCICFNNSTIIVLNPPPSSTPGSHRLDIRSPHADPFYPYQPDPPVFGKRDGDGDEDEDSNEDGGSEGTSPARPHHKLTCADCTRAFCLSYNLPICKNAREDDVFTTCFQRDSLKDETVVVIFIFTTAGLLAWAVVKPWIDRLRERNTFNQLPQHDGRSHTGGNGNGSGGFGSGSTGNANRNTVAGRSNGNGNGRRAEVEDEEEEDDQDIAAAPTPISPSEQDPSGLPSGSSVWGSSGTRSTSRY